eukprot:TRINITY_DN10943_c0_g3_i1.p1 TRINITY_DN10943_c0_g3~~TRINITY_DN10943_c0_g3_i1.p1  ORF type:complete len:211 (+),score=19.57 TRINITY_DN10943_c0_g3_i1:306-938(+)
MFPPGDSFLEQIEISILMHMMSFLDHQSLCCLSMTNSFMRWVSNNDVFWKVLYLKEFTINQPRVIAPNGWKPYYASRKAICNMEGEFFNSIRKRSLPTMKRLWNNSERVHCALRVGRLIRGYHKVMETWELLFRSEIPDFQIHEVEFVDKSDVESVYRLADAFVITKVNVESEFDIIVNSYKPRNGRLYLDSHSSEGRLLNLTMARNNIH